MKKYITSDLHFGHRNIMKFCPESRARYNNDLEFMNQEMIREWNALIGPEDIVYILGDVAFLPVAQAVEIMQQLNGRKILIEGNHDVKLVQHAEFRNCFEKIRQYYSFKHNGTRVIMSHYPFLEWDQMHRGSVHFHGHLHGSPTGQEKYRCRDVGMDATGAIAVDLDVAVADALTGQIKEHH